MVVTNLPDLISPEMLPSLMENVTGEVPTRLDVGFVISKADPMDTGQILSDDFVRTVLLWMMRSAERTKLPSRPQLAVGVTLLVLLVLVAGAVVANIEDWRYGEGLWYMYITLTTVGFGDFVPVRNGGMAVAGVAILVGLSVEITLVTIQRASLSLPQSPPSTDFLPLTTSRGRASLCGGIGGRACDRDCQAESTEIRGSRSQLRHHQRTECHQ
eukprot:NODE_1014_length_1323_cov_46.888540_g837_i0.p1 GENE.NODE_1014_length_1323_cov_46.888540_g837_i0~~NODE_1014_length_1323_cov_46.888540_g837_i0.p1  ORF type:complete len:214 (-),score=44.77 NODE_1014_length_1323_cov_46.888540_g837_i0:244-885(-)